VEWLGHRDAVGMDISLSCEAHQSAGGPFSCASRLNASTPASPMKANVPSPAPSLDDQP
jgi:hypothetical protein